MSQKNNKSTKPRIRPLALCILRRPADGKFLVMRGHDPVKDETFYRPLGGGIKFGETGEVAIRREMYEEIGAQLVNVSLIGFFENIFRYRDEPGHELVLMYEAGVTDHTLLQCEEFTIIEKKEPEPVTAVWKSLAEFEEAPLYPDGLLPILQKRCTQAKVVGGRQS